jgi:hypothetical protein
MNYSFAGLTVDMEPKHEILIARAAKYRTDDSLKADITVRIPDKVLVHSLNDRENLGHIYQLAAEKGVAVEEYPLENYKACGIIRKLADN